MSSKLPAMIYSAPIQEETFELDFGEYKPSALVRRKVKPKREDNVYSRWDALPVIVLEDIYKRLSIKERYYASQVCRNWNRIFYSLRVWETFTLTDRTLTRRKFNYYMGDQYVLDHHRTQLCLHRVARGIRRVVIKPMENFFNLYEFMTILSYFCENFEHLGLIRTLDFTFGCDYSAENYQGQDKVFGTGGKLLEALKRLMNDLTGLKHLSLQDLLLEKNEAMYLLDDVAYNCCETLRTLRVVNCCKEPYAMLHPACFINLQSLTISPQHLSEDNLTLLVNTSLRNLYLLQTKQTAYALPVSSKVWRECSRAAPKLRVHHILEGQVNIPVIWQEGAPVRSVIYKTPENKISIPCIFMISNIYCNTLEVLAYMGAPQYQDDFEDSYYFEDSLLLLSRCAPFLDTIVIRDRISTATILLLASQCRNLTRLIVRRRALVTKCEWPHNPEWSDSFYRWLKMTSGSAEQTAAEMSRILDCKWQPMKEDEFINFRL